jgi:hypothetical protein
VAKHVVSNAVVVSVVIRTIIRIANHIIILDVNASNRGARKNIVSAFKMEKSVVCNVNVLIVVINNNDEV